MGSLQLCVSFSVKDSLGGSSAYCTVLSRVGLKNFLAYFSGFEKGIDNWWQVSNYFRVHKIIMYLLKLLTTVVLAYCVVITSPKADCSKLLLGPHRHPRN